MSKDLPKQCQEFVSLLGDMLAIQDRRAAPTMWQIVLHALQEKFQCPFDLYVPQMMPCTWRHWLRILRAINIDGASTAGVTPYRKLCLDLWASETKGVLVAMAWLQSFDLVEDFRKLEGNKKQEFLKRVRQERF